MLAPALNPGLNLLVKQSLSQLGSLISTKPNAVQVRIEATILTLKVFLEADDHVVRG
jgi:hypothetical protein